MILHSDVKDKTTIKAFCTLEDRFRRIHSNKYDYSSVVYTRALNKVKIICKEHGVFEQTPANHLNGNGCPSCSGKKKKTTEEFILEAKEIHGEKYDYSAVVYISNSSKIKIICAKHGEFYQRPIEHLSSSGCNKCGREKASISCTKTTEEFILEAKEIHGEKYDYSAVVYSGVNLKIKISCKIHGEFTQSPTNHLNGNGCPDCSGKKKKTTKEFILEAKEIHGEKYDYSKVKYSNALHKVDILCYKHGIFLQTPNSHLNGSGCRLCHFEKIAELTCYEKYKGKKTTLYYIKINNYYKIGVTKESVESRFKKEKNNNNSIEAIKQVIFEDGVDAFIIEQSILSKTLKYMVTKGESPIAGGWTEVRSVDISEVFDNIVANYKKGKKMIITKNGKKQEIETISTPTIEAIISREEMQCAIHQGVLDKENLVLISISEPVFAHYSDEKLSDEEVQGFKDSLRVKFWDIEETIGSYCIISDEIALEIQNFILKNLQKDPDTRFIVHCRAGVSRSAAVGRAIEQLKFFGAGEESKYKYKTSFDSEISKHSRYCPNLTVFDAIVKDYNQVERKSE